MADQGSPVNTHHGIYATSAKSFLFRSAKSNGFVSNQKGFQLMLQKRTSPNEAQLQGIGEIIHSTTIKESDMSSPRHARPHRNSCERIAQDLAQVDAIPTGCDNYREDLSRKVPPPIRSRSPGRSLFRSKQQQQIQPKLQLSSPSRGSRRLRRYDVYDDPFSTKPSNTVEKRDVRISNNHTSSSRNFRRRSLRRYENGSFSARDPSPGTSALLVPLKPSQAFSERGKTSLGTMRNTVKSSLVALAMESSERLIVFRTLASVYGKDSSQVRIVGEYLKPSACGKTTAVARPRLQRHAVYDAQVTSRENQQPDEQGQEYLLFFGSSHAFRAIMREKERKMREEEANQQEQVSAERGIVVRKHRHPRHKQRKAHSRRKVLLTQVSSSNIASCASSSNRRHQRNQQILLNRVRKALISTISAFLGKHRRG